MARELVTRRPNQPATSAGALSWSGPSVLGQGWWIVKNVNGRSTPWMTYTVPEDEVVRVVRRTG